jgi:hypothetical protein
MEMRIKIHMGTHICIDMCENLCIIKQNIVVEIQNKKQTETTGDMVACMSAFPRGMDISKSVNRYNLSA